MDTVRERGAQLSMRGEIADDKRIMLLQHVRCSHRADREQHEKGPNVRGPPRA